MPKKLKYSEEELVSFLRLKDERVFSHFYDHYSTALFGVINKIIVDDEASEDVLQGVFLKVWQNIHLYDASKGRLFTWLLNIARNAAIDYTKSKQGKMREKTTSSDKSTYEINKSHQSRIADDQIGLKAVVDQLKDDQRTIIDLAFFEGYTHEEIAEKLSIPLGTVKTRARTAIGKLRELFK